MKWIIIASIKGENTSTHEEEDMPIVLPIPRSIVNAIPILINMFNKYFTSSYTILQLHLIHQKKPDPLPRTPTQNHFCKTYRLSMNHIHQMIHLIYIDK